MEKIKTTVRIAGRDYTMSGTDSEEHMHRVAAYVDRKMDELSRVTRMPSNMIPVLAAMNVSDELLKAQDENRMLRKELIGLQQKVGRVGVMQAATAPQIGSKPAKGAKAAPSRARDEEELAED